MKIKSLILIQSILILAVFSGILTAKTPPAGMVLMRLEKLHNVTSKSAPNDYSFSFEELIQWGVNGVHMNSYTYSGGTPNNVPVIQQYTQPEFIHEAHEHGFWVCGGVGGNTVESMSGSARHMAGLGADFIELFWPLDQDNGCVGYGETFGEAQYQQVKTVVNGAKVEEDCPVLITDRKCLNTFKGWASLDGMMQVNFSPTHLTQVYPNTAKYKAANPGKFVGTWTWFFTSVYDSLPEPEKPSLYAGIPAYSWAPVSDFTTLFNPAWNDHKNVILFPFTKKSKGMGWSWGVDWEAKKETIKNVTQMGETIPEWQSFALLGKGAEQSAPDIQVQVKGTFVGMNPASIQCFYTLDSTEQQNTKWIRHYNVSATGESGTKDWVTITAKGVPFNQISPNNKVMFKIQDTYGYKYHRNPRYWKREFAANITALDWTNLSNEGTVTSLPADMTINIQNAGGLDVASVTSEYSTDGGATWNAHEAKCSGTASSTIKETVTVSGVPFIEQAAGKNKIRFSIKTSAGETLKSEELAVKARLAPVLSHHDVLNNTGSINITLGAKDAKGLRAGSQPSALEDETVVLLHLDGDVNDASVNGYHGKLFGNAAFVDHASWKTGGASEKILYLDGDGDYADFGFRELGRSRHLTVSAWIKAESDGTAIVLGSQEENGSLNIVVVGTKISIQGYNKARTLFSLASTDGSFSKNAWHHVTFTFDGTTAGLYIDGNLKSSANWAAFSIFKTKPLRLGNPVNRNTWFKGYIDEVHVISKAQTSRQVAANFYSGAYRYTIDGGTTWSNWKKSTIDKADGTLEMAKLTLANVPFETKADSVNRIQVVARDIPGNVSEKIYYYLNDFSVPVEKMFNHTSELSLSPNPFRYQTKVSFSLQHPDKVDVKIYGMNGKLVRNLYAGILAVGNHSLSWDGNNAHGGELSQGQYFCKVKIGNREMVRKVLMLK
ncbi:MAG: T9SS type A sorting domain-containing protein [Fibrobacteria bacterium]|nr:T9SS type A sorting domain-containing protein [Fibrobacteria bacterium]